MGATNLHEEDNNNNSSNKMMKMNSGIKLQLMLLEEAQLLEVE